ncbi:MAG: ParB/RepB/Spo0J family partition protein [Butyrivibrio sp.]|jgi:ParB family chromosome partitioning protein|uniref:ParB/RepB/Spo0J family partition protein n=1 Tax=Butyrivibrio sp. TaxID=28121 RepID=UPI001B53BEC0|nr:ParB/RepB/Spo0J family partition protein [Butyrivibrio sp.]MBP3273564.1 ParB/RepB/Spo0J family partition protein [Butyrivibrio sp.]MBP3783018.1 ParB/RepB/Spo0J family partition protein [Butyrivibrio sp.]
MAAKSAKRGLGKGLDSIIPAKIPTTKREDEEVSSSKAKPADGQVQNLKITEVEPNKDQPRKTFNEDDLLELADSIKQHGIITPLLVTKRNGMYMIVAGERRWRAARKAGLKEVPAVVKNLTDEEIAEIAIIENLQRVGINPIEEAFAFKQLIDNHGYTQDQVAEKISKSRVYVTNSMRLLKLTKKVQDMVIGEMLTAGHARALLSITNEADQEEIAQQVFDSNLSVRETEKLVKNLGKTTKKKTQTKANPSIDAVYADVSEKCKQALGTKVEVTSKGDGVGVIQIEFYNNDDLEKIINRLCKE